ncbi:MAG: c-type cytochrome [Campylobacteraceae bacterium]|nr:c-type cytochrome [Campylobacteraceae bacterium]
MKIFLSFILISLLFLSYAKEMSDAKLRLLSKKSGLESIPKTYKELLKRLDTAKNRLTAQKINLGRTLFFEPLLSKDETLTCASCHKMGEGGDDNLPTAIGYKNRVNPKHLNSPTVLNASLSKFLFWDGRAKSVEEQAGGPIQAHFEMNLTPKELIKRLSKNQMYQDAFKEVFEGKITFINIKKAIGAYERTLLTHGKYDDFLDGNDNAISKQAKLGLEIFIKNNCVKCHYGATLGGQSIEKFPKYKSSTFPFKNVGNFKGKDDKYLFRVPLLRNIIQTAPYYHNGAVKSLKNVIKIESKYESGEKLDKKQIDYILEFFKTLNGKLVDYGIEG